MFTPRNAGQVVVLNVIELFGPLIPGSRVIVHEYVFPSAETYIVAY